MIQRKSSPTKHLDVVAREAVMFHHAVTLSHGMVGGENKQIPLPETTKVGIFKNVTVKHYAQAKLPCLCFVLHLVFSLSSPDFLSLSY